MTKKRKTTKKDTAFSRIGTRFKKAGKISAVTLLKILKEVRPDEITLSPGDKTITLKYSKEF